MRKWFIEMANNQDHIELLHKSVNTIDAKLHVQHHQHINQPATNNSYLFDQMVHLLRCGFG